MIEDNTLTDEQIDDASDSERDQYLSSPEAAAAVPSAHFVEAVAKNIRIQLARKNVTQAQAAQAIGLLQPSFSRRLTGETGWLFSELLGLARFFNVSFSVLAPDDLVER
jgi:hypothetical protein